MGPALVRVPGCLLFYPGTAGLGEGGAVKGDWAALICRPWDCPREVDGRPAARLGPPGRGRSCLAHHQILGPSQGLAQKRHSVSCFE